MANCIGLKTNELPSMAPGLPAAQRCFSRNGALREPLIGILSFLEPMEAMRFSKVCPAAKWAYNEDRPGRLYRSILATQGKALFKDACAYLNFYDQSIKGKVTAENSQAQFKPSSDCPRPIFASYNPQQKQLHAWVAYNRHQAPYGDRLISNSGRYKRLKYCYHIPSGSACAWAAMPSYYFSNSAKKMKSSRDVMGRENYFAELLPRLNVKGALVPYAKFEKPSKKASPETPGFYKQIMIMEYCSLGDLHGCITEGLFKNSELRQKAMLIRQLLAGVAGLHRNNIIHRDLKPENILLTRALDGSLRLKICDFDTACQLKTEDEAQKKTSKEILGTKHIFAPEVFRRYNYRQSCQAEPTHDIWSAGILVFELCFGCCPPYIDDETQAEIFVRLEEDLYPSPERYLEQFTTWWGNSGEEVMKLVRDNQPLYPLIYSMLRFNPAQRFTAQQTLDWVQGFLNDLDKPKGA